MTISELLNQARQRLQNAESEEDREAAQAELDRLEWARQQGLSTGDQMGSERDSGHNAGLEQARRDQAQRLGVPLEQLDDELERLAAIRQEQQSEADRLREQNNTLSNERDTFAVERDNATSNLENYRINEALTSSLDGQNLRPGRRALALRAVDRSNIGRDDQGNLVGVEDAVRALSEEEPSWFGGESVINPPEPHQRQQGRQNAGGNLFSKLTG